MNPGQKLIVDLMESEGFHLVRANNHFIWSDGKMQIVTPKSPSDNKRCIKNLRSLIRRKRMGSK